MDPRIETLKTNAERLIDDEVIGGVVPHNLNGGLQELIAEIYEEELAATPELPEDATQEEAQQSIREFCERAMLKATLVVLYAANQADGIVPVALSHTQVIEMFASLMKDGVASVQFFVADE